MARAKLYEYRGELKTLKEISHISDIKTETIRKRIIKQGYTVEEALNISRYRSSERKLECLGERRTVKEWANYTGLSKAVIYNRLRKGMSPLDALTAPKRYQHKPSKPKPLKPRSNNHLPEGFYFIGPYDVRCPDGTVISGLSKGRKHIPKPGHSICEDCGATVYYDLVKRGYSNPKRFCNKACVASYRNRRMAGVARQRQCTSTYPFNKRTNKLRAKHYGGQYVPGITAEKVAVRDGMICTLCRKKVVPHPGCVNAPYNPRAWSIGHIVAMSKGGDHLWSNVQCECIECNIKKGTKTVGQLGLYPEWQGGAV